MKTYKVTITETLQREVEVEAGCAEQALIIVTDAYNNGDHVLDQTDFRDVEIKTKTTTRNRDMAR